MKLSLSSLLAPCAFALAALGAGEASASLLGTSVSGCTDTVYSGSVTLDPTACDTNAAGFDSTEVIVDPGVEFSVSGGVGTRTVDFTANTVTLTYGPGQGSASNDLYVFTGFTGLTGLTLISSNLLDVTWDSSSTAMAFLVTSPTCCTSTTESVTFQIGAVPLPAGILLLPTALGALAITRRRRRKAA